MTFAIFHLNQKEIWYLKPMQKNIQLAGEWYDRIALFCKFCSVKTAKKGEKTWTLCKLKEVIFRWTQFKMNTI